MNRLPAYQHGWCNATGVWPPIPCELHDGGPGLLHGSGRCILMFSFPLPVGAE